MPRQPILALGLLTTLALVVGSAGRSALADDPPAAKSAHAEAAKGHAAEPAKGHDAGAGHAAPAANAPAASHGPAEHAPAEGHGAAANPNILEVSPPLAVWTVVVFVILLLILGKFAWGPILQALHDREEHIQHALTQTETARNEAERLLAENRKQLAAAADQVRALIEEGRRDAQNVADGIVKKAQAEAEASLQRAEREIGSARDQALSEIFSKAADLAVTVAGKVLAKELDGSDHQRLVQSAIQELPASANGQGVKA